MASQFASLPLPFRFLGFDVLTLVVKSLPEPRHQVLKSQAHEHHRSITEQAIFLLERGLLSASRRDPIKLRKRQKTRPVRTSSSSAVPSPTADVR